MTARYGRVPSAALLDLLADGALLAPLRRRWTVAGLVLDLQFRENDVVSLYCGLTILVKARRTRDGVLLSANPAYATQPCAQGLFRRWRPDETGLADALQTYLARVQVDARWVHREGGVQAAWMAVEHPWYSLDREAVIGRGTSDERSEALDHASVLTAFNAVDRHAISEGWQRPTAPRVANKLDQLGIDPTGRLVLVELKHAAANDVSTAPLQALRYIWEWHTARAELLPSLNDLLAARRTVGLVPASTPDLSGELRAVVAWGAGAPSDEVLRRMHVTKAIVDAHLPDDLDAVEAWSLQEGRAVRVA